MQTPLEKFLDQLKRAMGNLIHSTDTAGSGAEQVTNIYCRIVVQPDQVKLIRELAQAQDHRFRLLKRQGGRQLILTRVP